jgi:hypothetical protein
MLEQRPGSKVVNIGGGLRVHSPASAALSLWWLLGGIDPARCIAAYQPKGAADLAASYINLANPGTYNAAAGVAPGWTAAGGWALTGAQYLLTGITPEADQTWSMIARVANVSLGSGGQYRVIAGARSGDNRKFELANGTSGDSKFYYANGASPGVPPAISGAAVMAIAGAQGYRNGTADGVALAGWGGASTYPISIGATRSGAGTNTLMFVGDILALAIYDVVLTLPQVATISTAMVAL